MLKILKKNWDKTRNLLLSGLVILSLLLVTVVYKSDDKITKRSEILEGINTSADLKTFKDNKSFFALTAHIIYNAYDQNNAATHSKILINKIRI